MTSGATAACSQANSSPVRPKPVAISSSTSSRPCSIAELAQQRHAGRRVKAHPPRPLHDRLDDDRRQLARVSGDELAQLRGPALVETGVEAIGRALGEHVLGEHAREQAVHAADRIADRHRAERVAVVAATHGQQARALRVAARALELQAQLDRHLHRDRPRVREEHRLQRVRRERQQPLGQAHRGLVREPAEHHVRHARQLLAHSAVERRVAIAVNRTPPRRHPVDQLAPVGERQANALRRHHRQRLKRPRQRTVRMPNMLAVKGEQSV